MDVLTTSARIKARCKAQKISVKNLLEQTQINRNFIYDLEKGIREQLFPGKKLTIKIVEKYRLSGQYTPQKLFRVYKDSLLMELKHYSIIEYVFAKYLGYINCFTHVSSFPFSLLFIV